MRHAEYAGPVRLRAMQSLAERVFPVTGYRHVGDLAWNWTIYHDQPDRCPTALWWDGDEVVAWAWLELPDGLMAQVDPAYPDLADDVLAWAEDHVSDALAVEVCQTETPLTKALTSRGYTLDDGAPFMVCLARELSDLPASPELPDGYAIRAVRPEHPGDLERRAAVHRAAFGSTRITAERHEKMTGTWPYQPGFDLVVEAPDGDFAAYCQGWYDETNQVGEYEPVGTHPGHQRRGLARAVCIAQLHAFAAAGGRGAVVNCRGDDGYPAPKKLYESLGFSTVARTVRYRRRIH